MIDEQLAEASPDTVIDIEALAADILMLRNKREAIKREYDARDTALKAEMEPIEERLRNHLQTIKATSIRTRAGTVLLQTTERYWPSDWESLYSFIHAHNAFHLLERRIHNTNMKQFLIDNPGEVPAGLNADVQQKAVVRKATS